ncbi:hypothetical protein GLOIN_2v1788557 [Rhizophagus irregularis DAOM 181602=DAOM 197198]|nr:hypothetical protein GLOIN_2v1788557 [Rhizophagus irregularis DAOM 181602=DAOM 197198]
MTTNRRYRLHGDCIVCGMHKNTFTMVDWVIKKKSKEKKKETAAKRQQTAYNRQCKLRQKILDADDIIYFCGGSMWRIVKDIWGMPEPHRGHIDTARPWFALQVLIHYWKKTANSLEYSDIWKTC